VRAAAVPAAAAERSSEGPGTEWCRALTHLGQIGPFPRGTTKCGLKLRGVATLRTVYAQAAFADSKEHAAVQGISDQLLAHLNTPGALELMHRANLPGVSSAEVQATFLPFATELGFRSEAKGLFREYENKLRPDYYRAVEGSGILLEVERGKTTTNNMDLLDFWKCHLCRTADYLFLMVPQALQHNPTMTPKREYNSVVKRLDTFFVKGNETNVRAVHIFGY
jgi:hypothetical protein